MTRLSVKMLDDKITDISKRLKKQKPSILMLEDEPILGQVIHAQLKHLGYETIKIYQSTAQAFTDLEKTNINNWMFALVDILIRNDKLNGFQFAEKLIKDYNFKNTIIYMTGHTDQNICNELKEMGKKGYLHLRKPFGIELLRETLQCVLPPNTTSQAANYK